MDPQMIDEKKSDEKLVVDEEKSGEISPSSRESSEPYTSDYDSDDLRSRDSSEPYTSDYDSDDLRLFNEELERHGEYDFDSSNVRSIVGFYPVVFSETSYAQEPETNGELIHRLSKMALDKYNVDNKGTNLELVRAVKANFNYGGGFIFSITLEAKDAAFHHTAEPVTFHAKVRYLPAGSTVFDVKPKPL